MAAYSSAPSNGTAAPTYNCTRDRRSLLAPIDIKRCLRDQPDRFYQRTGDLR
ncbi:uncharacterized protein MEPE_02864 [Melanopsichium pennsylvanicum]|uniref:Uncharacterized protein n=1 Tax=Melanopsichium pennsylvanicum TaxID=63383 RepID=A0AAJ4XLH2_9BASI|nr:uncharacterized protein MEPE_02864 [Melanopsichium pennsylvanicum]